MSKTITISKQKFDELLSSASALTYYLADEKTHFEECEQDPKHIYNDVKKCEDLINKFLDLDNKTSIIERLEYFDSKCTESEIWIDNLTGKKYDVDVETIRHFGNIKEREL